MPLVEYDNNDIKNEPSTSKEKKALSSKTVSKYIEALTDKKFAVNVAVNEAYRSNYANAYDGPCLIRKITIDGITVHESSLTLFDTESWRWKIHARCLYSVENGVEGFKPFSFSKLAICTSPNSSMEEMKAALEFSVSSIDPKKSSNHSLS
ncbi:38e8033f-5e26-4192-8661-3fa5009b5bee [Sclerotinia trifoliorum]|uniref:38e8033f-5e26-4192-8661-3fa5009b5bee n=1 Tax=Sclerotinia trifoliorum TaxID=28548 RepID=A0A8H2VNG1_9HELO|nr:38e8033f-5e26-4192-8661-3fa5009b5bee [Sclerotinia trifoliorum]